MRVAGDEQPIWVREIGWQSWAASNSAANASSKRRLRRCEVPIFRNGDPMPPRRLAEARSRHARSRDRLPRPASQHAADMPAAGKARVENQRTIDKCRHGADILAKISKRHRGSCQRSRIVASQSQRSPGIIDALSTIASRMFARSVHAEAHAAVRGKSESRTIIRITCDRLLQQSKRLRNLLRQCEEHPIAAQMGLIGAEIARRMVA